MYCMTSEFFRSKDGREYFWQWDTNQTLTVLRPELTEVHYASPDGTALVTKTYEQDGQVLSDVPNILLQQSGWLTVWFCDDDKTIRSQKITIAARQKPASYVYTETEVLTWESLDERITALEENGTGGGGGQGKPGATFIPSVSEDGIISWENDGGLDNPEPRDITGPAGKDGKDGRDGIDGQPGKDGVDGKDGIDGLPGKDGLPGEKGEKGDKGDTGEPGQPGAKGDKGDPGEKGEKGEKGDPGQPGADGLPGAKGDKGDKGDSGEPGQDGKDGADGQPGRDGTDGLNGISPIVSVQDIDGGHRVTITDAEGAKTFDVLDGKDGTGGGGASVQSDWTVNDETDPAYVKGRTHWHETRVNAIRWNGLPEDRESVDVGPVYGYPTGFLIAYKISDEVLSKDKIASAEVKLSNDGGSCTTQFAEPEDLYPSAIWTASYQGDASTQAGGTIICTTLAGDFSSTFGVVIPSKGTYALQTSGVPHSISIENGSEEIWHTLDKKFLPSDLATGGAIVDVVELPTEDINEDVFYRLLTGTFVVSQGRISGWTCYCVETLPNVGEPVTVDMQNVTAYYNISDNDVYGFVPAALGAMAGVPEGWYLISMLAPLFGVRWGGIITNIIDDPKDGAYRLLLDYAIWSYKKGKWTPHKVLGKSGTGLSAEIFNLDKNISSGTYAHAEGDRTEASGDSGAHAEGTRTVASGDSGAHAEGTRTVASGEFGAHAEGTGTEASGNDGAHAEGQGSKASGNNGAHAEGFSTVASGNEGAHAEGRGTCAASRSQHVQGRFNVEDYNNQYAHIVGNGEMQTRLSNAHTLDWDGNAWYAGYVEGTALILPSPNGTRWRITVDDSGNLTTAAET